MIYIHYVIFSYRNSSCPVGFKNHTVQHANCRTHVPIKIQSKFKTQVLSSHIWPVVITGVNIPTIAESSIMDSAALESDYSAKCI